MKLILDNILTHVVESEGPEIAWLNEYLSRADQKNAFFVDQTGTPRRRQDSDIPRLRLLNTVSKTFPSGMARQVCNVGRDLGYAILVADGRVRPCEPDHEVDISWLYDFQTTVVHDCWKRTRGLIKSPTGSGKTEMMIALVMTIPCRWLLLVDDIDLVHNAARRFEDTTEESCGRIGDGIDDTEGHRFVCASFQSIMRRLKDPKTMQATREFLNTFGGLLIDECHITSASTYYQVATTVPAYWRFGFSGTPLDRTDGLEMYTIGALGDLITEVPTQLLIERKIIARPDIEMHHCEQRAKTSKNFGGIYGELVVRSTKRNNLVADLFEAAPRPGLLFVKQINHGKDLEKRLQRRGLNVEFIHGKCSTRQRDAAVSKLEWGDLDGIVVNKVWQKGKNIPFLETIFNAAGYRSLIPVIQMLGRGTRVVRDSEGRIIKDCFKMIDVLDRGDTWMQRHATDRLRAYRNEGHHVELVGA